MAAITLVSYTAITEKASIAGLESDLTTSSKKLELYNTFFGSYPTGLDGNDCPTAPIIDNDYCLQSSGNNIYSYYVSDGVSYSLTVTNNDNDLVYKTTDNTTPVSVAALDPADWIEIGTQLWARENLNVGTRIDGSTNQTDNSIIEKFCYDDNESNCTTYGAMYQFPELMHYSLAEGAQGLCPDGSHIPSDDEYKTLEMFLGMSQAQADATAWRGTDEGTKLKEGGSSGFEFKLGGYYDRSVDSFLYITNYGVLSTSSTEVGDSPARMVSFVWDSPQLVFRVDDFSAENENSALSVRCIAN